MTRYIGFSKPKRTSVIVNAKVNEANKTTLRSAQRSVAEKGLTGPRLLEMSGNPNFLELANLLVKAHSRFSDGLSSVTVALRTLEVHKKKIGIGLTGDRELSLCSHPIGGPLVALC